MCVLVLGACGGFGTAVTLELLRRGLHVRILSRDLADARLRFGNRANAEYLVGDAFDDAVISKAIVGCQGVVSALNLPLRAQCQRAVDLVNVWNKRPTKSSAATVAGQTPATPRARPNDSSDSPSHRNDPTNGSTDSLDEAATLIDVDGSHVHRSSGLSIVVPHCLEEELTAAEAQELSHSMAATGERIALLRTGRFFGSTVRNPLVDSIFQAALEWRTIRAPGSLDAKYPWTYAPDAARAAVEVLMRAAEPTGATMFQPLNPIDFAPRNTFTQREFLQLIGTTAIRLTSPAGPDADTSASRSSPQIGQLSSLKLRLASLTSRPMGHLLSQLHVWNSPPVLEPSSLARVVPNFVHTAPELAVRTTLTSYR